MFCRHTCWSADNRQLSYMKQTSGNRTKRVPVPDVLNLDILVIETTFSVQYRYTNNTAGKQIAITLT